MKYEFPMIIPVIIERLLDYVHAIYDKIYSWFLCHLWGIHSNGAVNFSGRAIVRTRKRGEITLGRGVKFVSRVVKNVTGLTIPVILDTRWGGQIQIGDSSCFSSVAISSKTLVKIGSRCLFGGNVRVFDHDFHSLDHKDRHSPNDVINVRSKPILVGNDVFIGANVTILKGSSIGDRSIVSAGSVVCGLDVPPDSLVRGNPAVVEMRSSKTDEK